MTLPPEFNQHRLLLYYKGDISALTLFAQHSNGSTCWPEPLPVLASISEPDNPPKDQKISIHPALLIKAINELLQLDDDILRTEIGFHEYIATPQGIITVNMARFNLLDPPHQMLQKQGFRLRTLPELRNRPPAELELLRRAYVKVMES